MSLGSKVLGPRGTLRRREAITGLLSVAPAIALVAFVIWYPVSRTLLPGGNSQLPRR